MVSRETIRSGQSPKPTRPKTVVLGDLTIDTCECAETAEQTNNLCSSKRVVETISQFIRSRAALKGKKQRPEISDAADASKIVNAAAKILNCSSESCVVAHPTFRQFVAEEKTGLGGVHTLNSELARRFKPAGPRDSTKLLSNFNIDDVLQQWAAKFTRFFNFDFNMIDFEKVGGSLARVDVAGILEGTEIQNLGFQGGPVRRPCNVFACVLNTDVSTGRGKHWVSIFGDCRGKKAWSIEYFNSAGNPPPKPIVRWLETSAARLNEYRAAHADRFGSGRTFPMPLTSIRHQKSRTECGLYSLFFIRRRLEGAPRSEFQKGRIPDSAMVEFRKYIFRKKE